MNLMFQRFATFIILLLAELAVLLVSTADTAHAQAAGWLPGWQFRVPVTLDNNPGAAKTSYQVKITLSSANFTFANAQSDGDDLRVADSDGTTLLDIWTEAYDSGAETAEIWAEVPTIAANSEPDIYLYYGNAGAPSVSDIEATFIIGEDFSDVTRFQATNISRSDPAPMLGNSSRNSNNPIAETGPVGQENQVREPGSIIFHDGTYYFFVSGIDSSNLRHVILYTATSITGAWTRVGVVLDDAEDPHIIVDVDNGPFQDAENRFYMYYERYNTGTSTFGNRIGLARSTSLLSGWTEVSDDVLPRGAAATWDDNYVASPTVLHDGSQFVMLYEGQDGTNPQIGVARSPTGLAASWTKEATNPVRSCCTDTWDALGVVPDDVILQSGTYSVAGHSEEGGLNNRLIIIQTTDAPADWNNTSFTDIPGNPFDVNNDWGIAHDPNSSVVRYVVRDDQPSVVNSKMWLLDDLGESSTWRMERFAEDLDDKDFLNAPVEIDSTGVLHLEPDLAAADAEHSMVLYSVTTPVTNNFELVTRRQMSDFAVNNRYANMGFGTDGPGPANPAVSPEERRPVPDDGYIFHLQHHSAGGADLLRSDAGSLTQLDEDTLTQDDVDDFKEWALSYLSDGSLSFKLDGSEKVATTSSTHLATNKYVYVSQGMAFVAAQRQGAFSQVDWLIVRNYDGEDPAATLGAESVICASAFPIIGLCDHLAGPMSIMAGILMATLMLAFGQKIASSRIKQGGE